MKEKKIKTYTFQELADETTERFSSHGTPKERARQWLIEGTYDSLNLEDLFKTELEQRGLEEIKPLWSLGYSQGDGVAFEGTFRLSEVKPIEGTGEEKEQAHIKEIQQGLKLIGAADAHVQISNHSPHYTHWNSFGIDEIELYDPEGEVIDTTSDKYQSLEESIKDWLVTLSRDFERMGYVEIEYQTSDEALTEAADANEYLFSEMGSPVHHLISEDE